jgi:hypothetical protein
LLGKRLVLLIWCYACGEQEALDVENAAKFLWGASGRCASCGGYTDAVAGFVTIEAGGK